MKAKFSNGDKVRIMAANRRVMYSDPRVQHFHNLTGEIVSSKEVVGYAAQVSTASLSTSTGEISTRTLYLYDVRLDAAVTIDGVVEDFLLPLMEN